jgi:hypothetical protein
MTEFTQPLIENEIGRTRSHDDLIKQLGHHSETADCENHQSRYRAEQSPTKRLEMIPKRHLCLWIIHLDLLVFSTVVTVAAIVVGRVVGIVIVGICIADVDIIFHSLNTILEILYTLAESFHQLRDFLSTEEQQYDNGNDDDFTGPEISKK